MEGPSLENKYFQEYTRFFVVVFKIAVVLDGCGYVGGGGGKGSVGHTLPPPFLAAPPPGCE